MAQLATDLLFKKAAKGGGQGGIGREKRSLWGAGGQLIKENLGERNRIVGG